MSVSNNLDGFLRHEDVYRGTPPLSQGGENEDRKKIKQKKKEEKQGVKRRGLNIEETGWQWGGEIVRYQLRDARNVNYNFAFSRR